MAAFEVLALDPTTPQIRAPGAADTYSLPRAITPSGANVTPITVSGYSLTGANAQSMFDLSGTWNTSGTPTALKLNITDTASNANSLLLDLQTGGTSRFRVDKSGNSALSTITTSGVGAGNESILLTLVNSSGAQLQIGRRNGPAVLATLSQSGFSPTNFTLETQGQFCWTNSVRDSSAAIDLILARDAANTFAQRNGTNAQTFNIYNTFTDASNYERLAATWSSNVAYIRPQNAGTGSARLFVPVTGATTVASLPAAATAGAGARAFVTDATVTIFLSTVAGGGANKVPVVSDGTNWLIG